MACTQRTARSICENSLGVGSTLTYKTTTGVGAAGADHIFQVGNNGATEAMRITNAGRVGIGTNNPGFPLDVQSSGNTQLKLMNSSTGNTSIAMDSAAASKSVEIDFYDAGVSKWKCRTKVILYDQKAKTGSMRNPFIR
jgi:uncharacterized protein YfaP (DUF2135 family)